MRQCRRCGDVKPDSEFRPIDHPTWQRKVCKECERKSRHEWVKENKARIRLYRDKSRERDIERASEWNKQNSEKHNKHSLSYYYRMQDKAIRAYGGYVCACCGETEPLFLTLDHTENNGREHRLQIGNKGGHRFYKWLEENNWPPGLQVLCMNCNHGKYRNNGICPHKEGAETIPKGSRAKRPEAPRTQNG